MAALCRAAPARRGEKLVAQRWDEPRAPGKVR
jgi:hypothetical protein